MTFASYSKKLNKQVVLENVLILLLFIGGANLFILIKTSGVDLDVISFSTSRDISILSAHFRVSEAGFVIGSLILFYENYVYPKIIGNTGFLVKRIIWQIHVALIIILPNFIIYALTEMIENNASVHEAFSLSFQFLISGLFLSFFIYYYLLSILISFFRRLHQTFGQHIFFNYLIGKYARPIEEDRVFMFIDLNDSTQLAEKLGHVKYSRLLNKCFDDIILATSEISYEIYQFVGDEIVMSWLSKNDDYGKAIEISNIISSKLKSLSTDYKSKFEVVPKFKSAVSRGKVTATLVGDRSRSIAYHGDVLNTAARLLSFCKKYNKELLFSKFYLDSITLNEKKPIYIDTLILKGKQEKVDIYAVN